MRSVPLFSRQVLRFTIGFGVLSLPLVGMADTVWLRAAGSKGAATQLDDVKFDRYEAGALYFTVQTSGRQAHKKFDEVAQVRLDDEPALSTAEAAFEAKDFKTAIESYNKAATSSAREWVRRRAALRLIETGQQINDLGASASGFAALALIDPDAAQTAKPAIAADTPKDAIDAAILRVRKAESTSGVSAEAAKALINFRIELLTAEKNTTGAAAALQELNKMSGGSTPSASGTGTSTPQASRSAAASRLNEARVAFAQNNFRQAEQSVEGASSLFTDPDQQAEALYLIAECKAAQAGNDPKALMDAGIAYMRVVAHFKSLPNAPHVAESLMKTASIEEKLAKPEEALRLYNQVAVEFKETASAKEAAEDASRLSASIKSKG